MGQRLKFGANWNKFGKKTYLNIKKKLLLKRHFVHYLPNLVGKNPNCPHMFRQTCYCLHINVSQNQVEIEQMVFRCATFF